jgi:hypothetical protein
LDEQEYKDKVKSFFDPLYFPMHMHAYISEVCPASGDDKSAATRGS